MALEAFLDQNSRLRMSLILPANGRGAIVEAVSSHNSLRNEGHMDSILSMAQLNANLGYDVMNSTFLENSSNLAYMQSHGNSNMEPYISLPSNPMSFSGYNNPLNAFRSDNAISHLCQGGQKVGKKQQLENTNDLCKTKLLACRASPTAKIKKEPSTDTPTSKKRRVDVNQEQKQEIIESLLLKELQDRNLQVTAMMERYGVQSQLQKPVLLSAPQFRGFNVQIPKQVIRSTLPDQGNLQMTFAPLLDGGICSRRLKQYLYHLRNNTHDNGIAYWKKFVSEYYAPDSKKRWCFCKYEDIQLDTTGVFYPKSMEAWCCDICGERSGKGLEATFNIFPRLFKTKFESGMVDEILFLDTPRACHISAGLVLEYRKAVQESVYEKFRVVHEGRLRIVFRHDLKILSWEFCAQNHEEFLLRRLVTPQVNQLLQASKAFQNDIQNDASFRVSSEGLQTLCAAFVSAGDQLAKNMETPLVNDLGYPKRFIRCLQIAEVVDNMKDVIALSLESKMGPIECYNSISSHNSNTLYNQRMEKQRMELFAGPQHLPSFSEQPGPAMSCSGSSGPTIVLPNHQLVGQNSSIASMRQKGPESGLINHSNRAMGYTQSLDSRLPNEACRYSLATSQSFTYASSPHQALVDKLLNEMASGGRGKSVQTAQKSNKKCVITRNELRYGESSAAGSPNDASTAVSPNITVKTEPYSPEQLPDVFQSSALGFAKIEDMSW